ncbi:MAG: acetoacetate--CoA ligase [Defluviicoccus sp.]|nr:acetoacetate--CoA ligase [Defluviicoccus sp.]MDE0279405.1 acetoacetate--CoA ligase [Defluviicoccus sp.]
MTEPLWTPSPDRIRDANLTRYLTALGDRHGLEFADYAALHRWSVENREAFWVSVWDFCGIVAETRGETVLADGEKMPGARWFPDARLNFAENLLRHRDGGPAIFFRGEDRVRGTVSRAELYDLVSHLARAFEAAGVAEGDRVAGYLPNVPEAIAAMLAAASIGAVWSSCSPDFGVNGMLDRFGQIEPKLLITTDGYTYNGKPIDSLGRVREALERLPSVESAIVVPYLDDDPDLDGLPIAKTLRDAIAPYPAGEIEFRQLPFAHPLYILFSSGTTGTPKCIVHGAGGTLLQHLKEHILHTDVRPGDRVFYATTLGWMMWNWLASTLAAGATALLYEGSVSHPGMDALFDFADESGMTHFGTSAKYIDAVKKSGLAPRESHDLGPLRAMMSTGSPLVPESFDFVYSSIKRDLCLSSISGGTDIVSCFVLGNPTAPVRRGEIQAFGLGMDVRVYDDGGRPVTGEKGELVCARPFPAMPVKFWNDPDGARYRGAYFERFPDVWCHGDYAEITEHGGTVIYGRSDAVLNPGGVRIGTAEIYRQVEQLDEIEEGLAIGQDWDGDVRVVLFVRLAPGCELDGALEDRIRDRVRRGASPRHVPARIVAVPDIPRTKSGKIVELAVRSIVHGEAVRNIEALANPEALDHFRAREELAE